MKKIVFTLFSIFILCGMDGISAQGYRNPVISGFHPDPSICRLEDDFYLVNSSFEYFPGVPIFHSKDLVNWKQIGNVLTRDSQLPLQGYKCSDGIYAPTLRYHNGKFYMVTTNVGKEKRNFYVTAEKPEGPWSEPVWVDQSGIDPDLFWDDDGKCYFTSNRGMTFDTERAIYQSEIDIETGKRLTEPKIIWRGTGGSYVEGPHIYKCKGWYYLIAAEGGTAYGHMVTVARSRKIDGMYESCPHNPILSNRYAYEKLHGTGHADMVELADGSWWMVNLAFRSPQVLGRETCLAPVMWDENGWPVVNKNGTLSEVMNVKTLPLVPVEKEPVRDEFDSLELGNQWLFLRNPERKNYSLTERPGYLRMKGAKETLSDLASPTFLGRRQQHFNFNAITKLSFNPKSGNEEAGLTILMTNTSFYRLCLVNKNGKRFVQLRYNLLSLDSIVKEVELKDGDVELKITGDSNMYKFYFRQGQDNYRYLGEMDTRFLSAEVTGGYNGVIIGMYATGNGIDSAVNADFHRFDYIPLGE